jgi:anti-sigma factor RsiW
MTSKCNINRSDLSGLRDAELNAVRSRELATHVEGCPRCQGELADMDALGELLVAQRAAYSSELAPDFASSVMASLPAAGSARPTWAGRWAALVQRHRDALAFSLLGAAVAASLVVVFAPGLRTGSRVEEAAENEAEIHQLDVSGTDQNAVVLQSAEGNTVIWLVSPSEDADGGASQQSTH